MLFKHLMPRMHLLGVSMSIAAGRTAMAQVPVEAPASAPAIHCVADTDSNCTAAIGDLELSTLFMAGLRRI